MLLISISLRQHLFFKTRKGTFPDMGAAFRLKKVWGTNGPRPFSFGVCATKKIPATSAGRKAQNVKSPTVRDLFTAGLEIVNTLDADAVSLLRKKLVATASCREGVYNRAGEPSAIFCGKGGGTTCVRSDFYKKIRASDTKLAPTWLGWLDSDQRDDGVKVRCLTTWRQPNIQLYFCRNRISYSGRYEKKAKSLFLLYGVDSRIRTDGLQSHNLAL